MKKHYYILLLLGIIILNSYKKEEEQTNELTNDEAAEVMEASVSSNTAGITESIETISQEIIEVYLPIGGICDSTFVNDYTKSYNGSIVTANYSLNTITTFTCPNFIPKSAQLEANTGGQYSGERVSSDDNSSANFTFDSILPPHDYIIVNGTYTRNGNELIKTRNTLFTFSSETILTAQNIQVAKSDYTIVGGSATVNLNITTQDGSSQNFAGSITFIGNNKATLTINNNSFTIKL